MLYKYISLLNHKLITNDTVTDIEKERFIETILVRCKSQNWSENSQCNYPYFLVPTNEERDLERSKKLRLITGELPKTALLSHNAYELEALRLLCLLNDSRINVEEILEVTAQRLVHMICKNRHVGAEYIGLSLIVLRFWNTYKPRDIEQLNRILLGIIESGLVAISKQKKNDIPFFYLWLTLSEIADKSVTTKDIILMYSQDLYRQYQKGWLVNPNNTDRYNPLRKFILKNALSKLAEYEYLKSAEVIMGKDGRCYGSINELSKL